jgi:glutathione S-transferase
MKLYSHPFSHNAKRARIGAAELDVPLTVSVVDFGKGEHKSPAYLAMNPNGKVPVLQDDDGFTLWESPAMLVYLAAKNPAKGLLPSDPRSLADAMRWMFWNASHFERSVDIVVHEKLIKAMRKLPADEAQVKRGMDEIARYAPVLNAQLEGKSWLLGDKFSIADISVGVTAELGAAVGLNLAQYPHLAAWLGRCKARESWKKAG